MEQKRLIFFLNFSDSFQQIDLIIHLKSITSGAYFGGKIHNHSNEKQPVSPLYVVLSVAITFSTNRSHPSKRQTSTFFLRITAFFLLDLRLFFILISCLFLSNFDDNYDDNV